MSSLRELQERVYAAIALEAPLTFQCRSQERDARLEVYRNNARETFRRALAAMYPVVQQLVGEPCFRTLARDYAREFPSRSGDLDEFGRELGQLLDIYYGNTEFAYLADVARLEAAVAAATAAPEATRLDPLELRAVTPGAYGSLAFTLHPTAHLLDSRWPVLTIWRAHQGAEEAPVDLRAGAEHVLVLRHQGRTVLRKLDVGTFALAWSLADGERLGDALEAALAADEALDAGAALASLAALGVFAGFGFSSHGLA